MAAANKKIGNRAGEVLLLSPDIYRYAKSRLHRQFSNRYRAL